MVDDEEADDDDHHHDYDSEPACDVMKWKGDAGLAALDDAFASC